MTLEAGFGFREGKSSRRAKSMVLAILPASVLRKLHCEGMMGNSSSHRVAHIYNSLIYLELSEQFRLFYKVARHDCWVPHPLLTRISSTPILQHKCSVLLPMSSFLRVPSQDTPVLPSPPPDLILAATPKVPPDQGTVSIWVLS